MDKINIKKEKIHFKKEKKFFCDGQDEEGEGHPKVFLYFKDDEKISCPYCGNIFKFKEDSK